MARTVPGIEVTAVEEGMWARLPKAPRAPEVQSVEMIGATLRLGGTAYTVAFLGFDLPMDVRPNGGGPVRLWPWTLGEHLDALEVCMGPAPGGIALDGAAYAERVLAASGVPETRRAGLAPLALWWASGGRIPASDSPLSADRPLDPPAGEIPSSADGGWVDLGGPRARLRPWSADARQAALEQAVPGDSGQASAAAPIGYLREMLRHSVVAIDPPMTLEELDSGSAARLVAAAMALNGESAEAPARVPETPEAARQVLRLCFGLGWTPSPV